MNFRRICQLTIVVLVIGLILPIPPYLDFSDLTEAVPLDVGDPWCVLWMRPNNEKYTAVNVRLGAVFVAGTTPSPLEIIPPIYDILITRYNTEGNPQWNRTWSTSYDKQATALATSIDSLYLVGNTDTNANGTNGILIRFDFLGNEIWNTTFGGPLDESFTCLALGSDGIYVGGSVTNASSGHIAALVVKFDFNGLVVWNETWSFDVISYGRGIAFGTDGGYLAGSVQQVPAMLFEGFLLKFSPTGIQMWNTTITPQQYKQYSGVAVHNESVYVTGISKPSLSEPPQLILEQFNSSGNLHWTQMDEMGLNHEGFGLYVTEENVYVGGIYEDPIAGYRASLLYYNSTGEFNWKRTWGGAGSCQPYGFSSAGDGIYFAGTTDNWLTDSHNGFLTKFWMDGTAAPGPVAMAPIFKIDSYGSLQASWTSAYDPSDTIVDYELQMDTTPLFERPDITWAINGTSHTIFSRPVGVYYFRVRARDNQGFYGPWSNIQMVTVALIPPTLFNPWLAPAVLLLGILIILAGVLFIAIRRGRLE